MSESLKTAYMGSVRFAELSSFFLRPFSANCQMHIEIVDTLMHFICLWMHLLPPRNSGVLVPLKFESLSVCRLQGSLQCRNVANRMRRETQIGICVCALVLANSVSARLCVEQFNTNYSGSRQVATC